MTQGTSHDFETRLQQVERAMAAHSHAESAAVIRLEEHMKGLALGVAKIEREMITKDEFAPVKNVVYGLVALILTSVFGALIGLVIMR